MSADTIYRVVADRESEHGFTTTDVDEARAYADAGYEVFAAVIDDE